MGITIIKIKDIESSQERCPFPPKHYNSNCIPWPFLLVGVVLVLGVKLECGRNHLALFCVTSFGRKVYFSPLGLLFDHLGHELDTRVT